jgi:large subunit ribosomal protein L29
MKARDLKQLSDSELFKRIEEEEHSLANLHFQKVTSQLENPMKLGQTRREIARMKTILRQRQLTASAAPTPQPVKEST